MQVELLPAGAGRIGSRDKHWVAAALAPDGMRTFRVDGRQRSGKQVREFLGGCGINLGGISVALIKQAQVTCLADSNSPQDMAAVVAAASGLERWNEEIGAAGEELRRTRKALADVQGNLLALVRVWWAGSGQLGWHMQRLVGTQRGSCFGLFTWQP